MSSQFSRDTGFVSLVSDQAVGPIFVLDELPCSLQGFRAGALGERHRKCDPPNLDSNDGRRPDRTVPASDRGAGPAGHPQTNRLTDGLSPSWHGMEPDMLGTKR